MKHSEKAREYADEMWRHLAVVMEEKQVRHNDSNSIQYQICQCWNHAASWAINGMKLQDQEAPRELLEKAKQILSRLEEFNPDVVNYKKELSRTLSLIEQLNPESR